MTESQHHRDVVVIGASAGGLDALATIVAAFPADLDASVFVVLHLQPGFASALPDILSRRGPLRASHPLHGEPIERGRIYVASPDTQLLVRRGAIEVVRGPKENGHRPSIDALFRTASASYGPRVVAALLTGYLDCGTAGLMSVKARGGMTIVEDPESAVVPDMPRSAVEHVAVIMFFPSQRLDR